jgi:putative hemolysin
LDEDSLTGIAVIIVLIGVHALLTMAHAALVNLRIGTVRDLAESGDRGAKRIIDLVASPNMAITYELLALLIRFAIVTVAILQIAAVILERNTNFEPVVVYVLTLFITGVITLILGELVPEAIGSTYANQFAVMASRLIQALTLIVSPIVLVILRISTTLSSVFRSNQLVNTITEEEIMSMIDAGHSGGSIEEEEKDMIYSVLQLDQTRASEVMVPRMDIVAVEINEPLGDAGKKFILSGFSRIPVYEENIDNIRGLLYAKDLLACWNDGTQESMTIKDLLRPVYYVPETKRADELLKEIQMQKVHMAIVVDEYGGTAGLVTIENIIEEIIGDIQDEYDLHEEAEYEAIGTDEYYIDASIDIDDFNELLDVELPTEDSDTLGGYIYTYLGRIPVVGETISTDDLDITVQSVEGRRIRKLHIIRRRTEESEAAETTDDAQAITETTSPDTDISYASDSISHASALADRVTQSRVAKSETLEAKEGQSGES